MEAGDQVEVAHAEAVAGLAILRGETGGPMPNVFSRWGYATDLGFDLWSRARVVELDTWVGPFEGVGNWFVLRVLERGFLPDEDTELAQLDAETGLKSYSYHMEWAEWGFVPPDWTPMSAQATLSRLGVVAVQSELQGLISFTLLKK